MRIVYGVFGYGRGHTTRALAVLPELERRHEVLLFASGMAFDMLSKGREVVRVPQLAYHYVDGDLAVMETLKRNFGPVSSLLGRGAALDEVMAQMKRFRPDVAICDVDPFTHRAAALLGVPRISFDHYGILAHCKPEIEFADRWRHARDVLAYRALTGRAQRIVVSSFYDAPPRAPDVRCVGPLLRDSVHQIRPSRGEHLLAYFNQPALLTPRLQAALGALGRPVILYGTARTGRLGRVEYRAASERGFLEDLASCHAVVGTAGNQLVGEALHFGKPLLVMPEDSVEQHVNAAAVERLGVGERADHRLLTVERIDAFLAGEPRYRDRTRWHARDGRAEAVSVLERFAAELAERAPDPLPLTAAA